jgi:type II secretory pathway pseudopilin PulG
MVALLVALSVMAVIMSAVLPVYSTIAKRERETELVFRGQQYARAVSLFQRKYGNALPPSIDVLLEQKFLRMKYKDPITGDDFQVVGPGSPELAFALNATPTTGGQPGQQGQQQGRGGQNAQPFGMNPPAAVTAFTAQTGRSAAPGQAPGGVLGVVSKSTATSVRLYNGHDKYNEWVFIATQMSVAAGTGGRAGRAGGTGGAAGRGGNQPQDGRGRGAGGRGPLGGPQQQPFGGPQQPFGGPQQPFGGAPPAGPRGGGPPRF